MCIIHYNIIKTFQKLNVESIKAVAKNTQTRLYSVSGSIALYSMFKLRVAPIHYTPYNTPNKLVAGLCHYKQMSWNY